MRRFSLMLALFSGIATGAIAQEATDTGTGAMLRGLDKLTGRARDIELRAGSMAQFGRIEVSLSECRYPEGEPASDAFAFVTVREAGRPVPAFRGWMVASSPALNAMDHQRYDVWVLRCTTS
ncbi:hypothetical protein AL036_21050 [Salipiger aestuarii]|uniref:DUF2155 domain-containing protein n=1 Tax=Salipiger aestuarii TaxID=568098 RepID=UPI00025B6B22|nr:DUF2155 domain-containing protein [Salipiger aestuarii]EIE49381.1 hypothetical protein C357_19211 [Citreicella sp. 357]KAA8605045.1 hypothetical protein AL036_21050 [Salipiger aestuarii]KAA8606756.1 hypothetical protein AL037_19900 [Salipiger aestuarii]